MLDWTKATKDPNDPKASREASNFLTSITKRYDGNKPGYVASLCAGKEMMDIGAGEHDLNYFNEKWEHAIYKKAASKIVAIEIDKNLCEFYNEKGFDFRCIDATSNVDIGDKFDFIYCGDVIEHVENTIALIQFAARHMRPNSLCVITTPNPYFDRFKNVAKANKDLYFIPNLEHISWITPSHMMEIIRRSNSHLEFESILIPEYAYQDMLRLGGTIESYFEEYIYLLRN